MFTALSGKKPLKPISKLVNAVRTINYWTQSKKNSHDLVTLTKLSLLKP